MSTSKTDWINKELDTLNEQGLLINIRTIEGPIGARILVDGKWVLNFCTNNYLGLANDKRLKEAAKKAIDSFGVGPTAVRTIAGTTKLHRDLEKAIAKFKKVEDVITFQSGFNANLATIPTLVGEGDFIFSDELNHASIIDACRLSRAEVVRYNHLDYKDLEQKISKLYTAYKSFDPELKTEGDSPLKQKVLIVTDGVFSMDGDIAPLPDLVKIANKYNALIMVDDAHGEGVLGKNGRGIVDHFKLHDKVDIEVGTMSKAFGVVGGYVAGKKAIIDWLRQRARPFLFSSAMTAPDVAACTEAVKILEKSDLLVKKLWDNTKYFKKKMLDLGFDLGRSQTPIVPVMLGEVKLAKEFSKKLFEQSIFAMAIGFPTVAKDKARIRVMMSASHTKENLDDCISSFRLVGKSLGVI
mgnify:CR=1 FL=1